VTREERRNLLGISAVAIVIAKTGLVPTKISGGRLSPTALLARSQASMPVLKIIGSAGFGERPGAAVNDAL
jgi:hypothetical protein